MSPHLPNKLLLANLRPWGPSAAAFDFQNGRGTRAVARVGVQRAITMTSDTQKSINRKFWQMKRVYFSLAAAFALGAFSGLAVLCPGHGGMTTDAVASTSGSGAVGSADASTDDSVQTDTAPLDTKTVEMDPSVNDPADVEAAPNSHLYPAEPHGVVDHVDEELLQRAPPPPHTASSPVLSTANKAGPRLREMKPSQPGCEGPEVHDTELYWEHVAEDRRIRFHSTVAYRESPPVI